VGNSVIIKNKDVIRLLNLIRNPLNGLNKLGGMQNG